MLAIMIPNEERAQLSVSLRETNLRPDGPAVRLPLFILGGAICCRKNRKRRPETEDVEALLFEQFLALAQTVKDGNRLEIIVHYQQKEVQKFEQPKLVFREKGG